MSTFIKNISLLFLCDKPFVSTKIFTDREDTNVSRKKTIR